MKQFDQLIEKIKKSYESGITVEEAERLAGEFLYAQIEVSQQLTVVDLDSRMRKSGLKAVKAAVYLEEATRTERKPSDVMLEAIINKSALVQSEQQSFDELDVKKNELENYLNIFREAHIFMRGVSRGRFE